MINFYNMEQVEQTPEMLNISIDIISKTPLSDVKVSLRSLSNNDVLFTYTFELIPRVSLETYVSTTVAMFNAQKHQNHEKKNS